MAAQIYLVVKSSLFCQNGVAGPLTKKYLGLVLQLACPEVYQQK